ncbi:MAG: hypothetical protein K1X64_18640 [Myxococcaceae bacterium]|nr:hypothetical protein [Myxococcaceae bacterium]
MNAGLARARLVIVGSASTTEVATLAEARALSEQRARVVADIIRKQQPDLEVNQIDLMPLGWDGFATTERPTSRVLVFGGDFAADWLPVIYVGPPVSKSLREDLAQRLRMAEQAAQGDVGYVIDAGGISFSIDGNKGWIDGSALLPDIVVEQGEADVHVGTERAAQVSKLLEPFFAALDSSCRFQASE